ncbi:MAG: glucuronate isomerase [Planctomycetota bacterium]|jgi:hypothetical protein
MKPIDQADALAAAVRRAVAETTASDIHTHLFPPSHGRLLLWGVDELLTYHYLVSELFKLVPAGLTPEKFYGMPKAAQAEMVWEHVFIRHGPLSEAARGVVTTLNAFGLDVTGRDLAVIRKWFAEQKLEAHLQRVLELAKIDYVIMTNDPFSPAEVEHWKAGKRADEILRPALRIDQAIVNWPAAARQIGQAGYKTRAVPNKSSYADARKFLIDWARKIQPVYLAASLPPEFRYPAADMMARAVREVVLPVAKELDLPRALMIGVRRRSNPALGDAGDSVGVADVSAVESLCAENEEVKFMVTMLSRVNQHQLCACARAFGNLHVFGCWWFCNTPSIIEEITRQRLELLGTAFTVNHSDARVLEQLIYKWSHTRGVLADVLAEKYVVLFRAGWRPTEDEIRRDVRSLLGGAFEEFLGK